MKGNVKALPTREDITIPIQEKLIVELYSKIMNLRYLNPLQFKRGGNMYQKSWKDLIRPKRLEVEKETLTPFYGKFTAEPFERGFGITIGNSLRRILLSSLQGAAITSVKIDGVLHEFSTIPGVKEDVTEIILNLKEVRLKLHTEGPKTIRVKAEGPKVLKAGDIITGDAVEILNPEHHIATLSRDGKLSMEMVVKMGRGYVPAERNKDENQPIGTIPIDAIFSPIKKVNYTVTNARVGQITDYDKLTLEFWTDGSLNPEEAVAHAAKILKDQLSIFITFEEEEEEEMAVSGEQEEVRKIERKPLPECGRVGTLCPIRQLFETCEHQIDRRSGSKNRSRDLGD